ncbi:hypothetical protein A3K73_01745 [Candidatus Pacearchaeota archaeon RBG_13_36_9]|nr:MAG: hypothetical protein A3K73_01745 [Candidatus Pacearchaeota archaeon RBG_13_36_9]
MYVAIIENTTGLDKGEWNVHSYASKESFLRDWNGAKCKIVMDSDKDDIGTVDGMRIANEHNKGLLRTRNNQDGLTTIVS